MYDSHGPPPGRCDARVPGSSTGEAWTVAESGKRDITKDAWRSIAGVNNYGEDRDN